MAAFPGLHAPQTPVAGVPLSPHTPTLPPTPQTPLELAPLGQRVLGTAEEQSRGRPAAAQRAQSAGATARCSIAAGPRTRPRRWSGFNAATSTLK